MSAAYDAGQWTDLFVACAGAAAALTGLVFVAVSINIERILAIPTMPERALQTLVALLGVVIVSVLALVPGQGDSELAVELLVAGIAVSATLALLGRGALHTGRPPTEVLPRIALFALAAVPFAVAGLSLLVGWGGGLYWVVAGILGAVVGGVVNAWVLLVEILR